MIDSRARSFRSLLPAVALAAALAVFVVVAPRGDAAPAKPLPNSANFPDSAAEDPAGPDISGISVSNDDKGNLTIVVNIPNRATLTGDMAVALFIDTDTNPATGDPDWLGADYFIELDGPLTGPAAVGLLRWNGSDFSAQGVPQTSLVYSYANGATIKISAAELGATTKFNFLAIAVTGLAVMPTGEVDNTNTHFDIAPDPGHGLFAYLVKTKPPSLVVKSFGTRPAAPRAKGSLTVNLVVARSDAAPIESATLVCKATVAGHALKPTSTSLVGTKASCTWSLPQTAKGKTIRGSITVQSGALKATKSFSAKIH